jgi:cytochrome P450
MSTSEVVAGTRALAARASDGLSATRTAPTPSWGPPFFGQVFGAWRDPIGTMMSGMLDHGDVMFFRFGPFKYFVLSDPAAIKHVLTDNAKNYVKSRNYQGLRILFGQGLLTSEGEFWKRQRRLAQPAFHRERLAGLARSMASETRRMLDRWRAEGTERACAHAEMMRLTFAIVGRTLFSTDVDGDSSAIGEALTVGLHWTNDYAESLVRIPPWVPTPANLEFRRAQKTLDDLVYRIIAERKRSGELGDDLLGMLMAATDETGNERMDDKQLRDEVLTLVLAGHETTANLLAFTFHMLSLHPEWDRRVAEEARAVLGDREPTFEDMPKLKIARLVLEETMRLYPPVWTFERQALADDVVLGYALPKDAIVGISPYALHRNPKLWDNPEGFDPERFLPERSEGRSKYAYLPFGGGPRTCIGNNFAMTEALIILSMVAREHRLTRAPGHRLVLDPAVTLRPKEGIAVTIGPRA